MKGIEVTHTNFLLSITVETAPLPKIKFRIFWMIIQGTLRNIFPLMAHHLLSRIQQILPQSVKFSKDFCYCGEEASSSS
jgi:hypothetical protein